MKIFLNLIFYFLFSTSLYAQVGLDSSTKKGIAIPADKKEITPPKANSTLNKPKLPTVNLNNPLSEPKPFYMEQKSDLMDAGVELEKRWKDKKVNASYQKDQYLGDFKTKGTFLSIECRDHEYVDGDKVRVLVNGVVVESIVSLMGYYIGINVDLVDGFNEIDFLALNQGTSGPNTAQFRVIDADGSIVTSQEWNLTTGVKATIIVVKE